MRAAHILAGDTMKKIKKVIKTVIRVSYKFLLLKIFMPLIYRINALRKIEDGRTVFVEVRLPELSNNFKLIWERLADDNSKKTELFCLELGFSSKLKYIKNCCNMARTLATARYIFISYDSNAFSCLPIRKGTTVIQVWHGCGALKRVGMSSLGIGKNISGGRLERKMFPVCRHMDFITISSPGVAWAYEEAFDLKKGDGQRICPVGTSRTDVFFMEDRILNATHSVRDAVGVGKDKKIILYAPTFRGETSAAKLPDGMNYEELYRNLADKYVLLVKNHPLIKEKMEIPVNMTDFVIDVTSYAIDDLLMAADICISDYSSLIFDYSLLRRPMIFFVYDIEEYDDWRGLYYPFEQFCPGPIAKTTADIISAIKSDNLFDEKKMDDFHALQMASCDGNATERIIALMDEVPDKIKEV